MKKILGIDYFTIKEVSKELGISISTVYNLVRTTKIKTTRRVGRNYYILPSDLKKFIDGD